MGKTNPGGLREGLFIWEYNDVLPLKRADNVPTAMGIRIAMMKALLFFIGIILHVPHIFWLNICSFIEKYECNKTSISLEIISSNNGRLAMRISHRTYFFQPFFSFFFGKSAYQFYFRLQPRMCGSDKGISPASLYVWFCQKDYISAIKFWNFI